MTQKKLNFFERDKKENQRTQRTFQPCAELKPIIKGYLVIECEKGVEIETLPRTSVSINFIMRGKISLKKEDGGTMDIPKAVALGVTRNTQCFTFSDQTTLLIAILQEGAASCLIKKPIHQLFARLVDLNDCLAGSRFVCWIAN